MSDDTVKTEDLVTANDSVHTLNSDGYQKWTPSSSNRVDELAKDVALKAVSVHEDLNKEIVAKDLDERPLVLKGSNADYNSVSVANVKILQPAINATVSGDEDSEGSTKHLTSRIHKRQQSNSLEASQMQFLALPDEIIIEIASYLNRTDPLFADRYQLSATCHRLRHVITNAVRRRAKRKLIIRDNFLSVNQQMINNTDVQLETAKKQWDIIRSIVIFAQPNYVECFLKPTGIGNGMLDAVLEGLTGHQSFISHLYLNNRGRRSPTTTLDPSIITLIRASASSVTCLDIHSDLFISFEPNPLDELYARQLLEAISSCNKLIRLSLEGVTGSYASGSYSVNIDRQYLFVPLLQLRHLKLFRVRGMPAPKQALLINKMPSELTDFCCANAYGDEPHVLQRLDERARRNVKRVCCVSIMKPLDDGVLRSWLELLPTCRQFTLLNSQWPCNGEFAMQVASYLLDIFANTNRRVTLKMLGKNQFKYNCSRGNTEVMVEVMSFDHAIYRLCAFNCWFV